MNNPESVFKIAHKHVASWEGYISDDAADSGGLTKYGVSLKFIQSVKIDVNKDGKINRDDVLAVTPEIAEQLFKLNFWNVARLDEFPAKTAVVFYDSAVNCGVSQTAKLLQRVLGISDDGIVGNQTVSAVNSASDLATAKKLCEKRREFYRNLASSQPKNQKFLKGWLNRVDSCEKLIENL